MLNTLKEEPVTLGNHLELNGHHNTSHHSGVSRKVEAEADGLELSIWTRLDLRLRVFIAVPSIRQFLCREE